MVAKMFSMLLHVEGDWSVLAYPPPLVHDLDCSSLSPSLQRSVEEVQLFCKPSNTLIHCGPNDGDCPLTLQ